MQARRSYVPPVKSTGKVLGVGVFDCSMARATAITDGLISARSVRPSVLSSQPPTMGRPLSQPFLVGIGASLRRHRPSRILKGSPLRALRRSTYAREFSQPPQTACWPRSYGTRYRSRGRISRGCPPETLLAQSRDPPPSPGPHPLQPLPLPPPRLHPSFFPHTPTP